MPDGSHVVHDYLHAARELELALAHVKAREYGSVFEAGRPWQSVWSDVGTALEAHRHSEFELCGLLAAQLDAAALDELDRTALPGGDRGAEPSAPVRPAHRPARPGGAAGHARGRRVLGRRRGPDGAGAGPPEHKAPGKVAQYLLADPRFDEEEPPPG